MFDLPTTKFKSTGDIELKPKNRDTEKMFLIE